jgi:hypothetical protein
MWSVWKESGPPSWQPEYDYPEAIHPKIIQAIDTLLLEDGEFTDRAVRVMNEAMDPTTEAALAKIGVKLKDGKFTDDDAANLHSVANSTSGQLFLMQALQLDNEHVIGLHKMKDEGYSFEDMSAFNDLMYSNKEALQANFIPGREHELNPITDGILTVLGADNKTGMLRKYMTAASKANSPALETDAYFSQEFNPAFVDRNEAYRIAGMDKSHFIKAKDMAADQMSPGTDADMKASAIAMAWGGPSNKEAYSQYFSPADHPSIRRNVLSTFIMAMNKEFIDNMGMDTSAYNSVEEVLQLGTPNTTPVFNGQGVVERILNLDEITKDVWDEYANDMRSDASDIWPEGIPEDNRPVLNNNAPAGAEGYQETLEDRAGEAGQLLPGLEGGGMDEPERKAIDARGMGTRGGPADSRDHPGGIGGEATGLLPDQDTGQVPGDRGHLASETDGAGMDYPDPLERDYTGMYSKDPGRPLKRQRPANDAQVAEATGMSDEELQGFFSKYTHDDAGKYKDSKGKRYSKPGRLAAGVRTMKIFGKEIEVDSSQAAPKGSNI